MLSGTKRPVFASRRDSRKLMFGGVVAYDRSFEVRVIVHLRLHARTGVDVRFHAHTH